MQVNTRARRNHWAAALTLALLPFAPLCAADQDTPPAPPPVAPLAGPPVAAALPGAKTPVPAQVHAPDRDPANPPTPRPAPEVDAPLDLKDAPPAAGANRRTVKITIKREEAEFVLEVPADAFGEDELKDLIVNYLPKPDPNAVNVRVYNLRKLGIDLEKDVLEKMIHKVARGPEEQPAEIDVTIDSATRVAIVTSWQAIDLARVDLLINALAKEPEMPRGMFMPGGPGGGPGGPGGGPGGPMGMRGQGQGQGGAQAGQPGGPGAGGAGGEGADAELQKRMQLEREMLKKRMEQKNNDNAPKDGHAPAREGRPEGAKPQGGPGGGDAPAPSPAKDEQF